MKVLEYHRIYISCQRSLIIPRDEQAATAETQFPSLQRGGGEGDFQGWTSLILTCSCLISSFEISSHVEETPPFILPLHPP